MSDLDFAMPVGSIVVAASDGVVRLHKDESKTGGFGWFTEIDHGNGYWTMYAHLSGFIVTEGQRVVAGQPIAYSGGKQKAPGAGTSSPLWCASR
jgi:murein DD-endopeptidase MepM/ murein hydrolase activator NlpD